MVMMGLGQFVWQYAYLVFSLFFINDHLAECLLPLSPSLAMTIPIYGCLARRVYKKP